jgi:hypothetical protein
MRPELPTRAPRNQLSVQKAERETPAFGTESSGAGVVEQAADRLAGRLVAVSLAELVERVAPGDQPVELEPALLVQPEQHRDVRERVARPEQRALDAVLEHGGHLPAQRHGALVGPVGERGEHERAALAHRPDGAAVHVRGHLAHRDDDDVRAGSPRQLPGQAGRFVGAGHRVGRPDRPGELALHGDRVDADDVHRAGVHRALHRVDAHAAQADDDHGVTRSDPAGIDRRAPAGRDAAGDERGGVQRQPGIDLHAGELTEQGVLREGADHAEATERLAVQPEGKGAAGQHAAGDRGALVAEVGPALRAEPAVPTGGQEARDDVVARRDAGDTRPHGGDDRGALVPADDRVAPARVGVPQVLVGVAEPRVGHLDEDLPRARIENLELDDLVLGLRIPQDCCSRSHPPMLPRRPGGSGTCPSVRGPDAGGAPSEGCLPFRRPSPSSSAPDAAPCSCTSRTRVRSTPAPPAPAGGCSR